MIRRRWLYWWISVALALLTAAPALAHANLVRSSPSANATLQAAPDEIRLWFSEPLEPNYSRFNLRDSSGNLVTTPYSQIDPTDAHQMLMQPGTLPDGLYTVAWRTVSAADGHSTQGSFAFGIGVAVTAGSSAAADESVLPQGVAIRWANLLALSLAVGSLGFWLFVGQPVALEQNRSVKRRWYGLAWAGWLLVGVSALLLLLLQVSTNAETSLFGALTSPALGDVLMSTTFGQLWIARIVFWVLCAAALWMSRRRARALWITLVLGLLMLLTQSLFSHASAAPDRAAASANDWLHLTSTAMWIGGLAAFALVLLTLRQAPDRTAITARLVAIFSNFARVTVAMLVVTGLYAAWLEVGSLDALLNTVYGRALIVKGVLLLPLLTVAAVNLILTQRGLNRGETRWFGRLRGLVGAEMALTVGILLAVGVMTSGSPARGVQALRSAATVSAPSDQSYFEMKYINNQMLHLQIVPGYVGENEFIVTPYDEDGSPITDASLIRLRFTNLDQDLGDSELRPQPDADGEYRASGANLSTPGQWRIRMTVARPGKFDTVVDFDATVEAPPAVPVYETTSIPVSERWWALALTGLALLGSGGFFAARARWRVSGGLLLALGGVGIGLVMVVSAAAIPNTASPESTLVNPIPADAASIEAGHMLYTQNCVLCHGVTGQGDGPVGITLNLRPADLTQHTIPGVHPDGQLYEWITNGYPQSAMPAFKQRLSDADRWNLVNYIRTLAQTR